MEKEGVRTLKRRCCRKRKEAVGKVWNAAAPKKRAAKVAW